MRLICCFPTPLLPLQLAATHHTSPLHHCLLLQVKLNIIKHEYGVSRIRLVAPLEPGTRKGRNCLWVQYPSYSIVRDLPLLSWWWDELSKLFSSIRLFLAYLTESTSSLFCSAAISSSLWCLNRYRKDQYGIKWSEFKQKKAQWSIAICRKY